MSENDFPNETADERSDADFLPFDETMNRSRMAREAKIGLSVIFILLVVLGFVVYDRMTRPDESPEATVDAEGSQAEEETTPAPEEPRPEAPPIDWTRQTAMDTKAASGTEKTTPPNRDSWGLRVEEQQASKPATNSTMSMGMRRPMSSPTPKPESLPSARTSLASTAAKGEPGASQVATPSTSVGSPNNPTLCSLSTTKSDSVRDPEEHPAHRR